MLSLLLAACGVGAGGDDAGSGAAVQPITVVEPSPAAGKPPLALFTSLPIYWPEVEDIGAMLGQQGQPHWARVALEREFALRPVDRLTALDSEELLLMAQPRALAPDENVALDAWVRSGGRVLLLVDPMLTAESRFALGDRRRPEAMAMLSPILARWGLALHFDPDQSAGRRPVPVGELPVGKLVVPVDLAGRLKAIDGAVDSACSLAAEGLLAHCRIGDGSAVIVADAALLDDGDDPDGAARTAFASLARQAFFESGHW